MIGRLIFLASLAAALSSMVISDVASARPLASIKSRGRIVLCANPNALPFASKPIRSRVARESLNRFANCRTNP